MSIATGRPRSERLRTIAAFFRKDVRRQRGRIATGMACAVVYALARVIEPWPLKVVFDQVLFHHHAHGVLLRPFTVFGTSAGEILAACGIALALAGVVRGVAYYYEDYLLSTAAQDIVYRLRARLYRHLHRLPVSFHQQRPTGELLVRLSADTILLRDVLIDAIVNIGTGVILLVLMLAVMLAVDPVLTAVALGVMPLILAMTTYYGPRIRLNSKRQRRQEGAVAAAMHEALSAMDVVQLHGAGDREHQRFSELNRRSLKRGTKAVRLEARMNRGVELSIAAGTVIVLWVGALRALHGAITPGELVVFVSYLRAAYRPLRRASKSVQRSAKALAAAERIVEVLDTEPDLQDEPGAVDAPPFAGRIRVEHVGFSYSDEREVLHDISLEIDAGKTLAVVGPTGSGKSTLVSLVPRLFDPKEGIVRIDGEDVRSYTLDSLRAQISVVRQESVLFGITLAENIRYGAPDATDEEVLAAADAAGLGELAAILPDGYDTVLSERGASLSGGERQRVAIARALIRHAPILILDEPTTGLDAERQEELVSTLRDLARRPATLLVTHDLRLVESADEIVVLDRGRVVARGAYEQLVRVSPEFRRLVAAQQRLSGGTSRDTVRAHPGDGPRVLFYSHNGVGVGHLQRQLDLAKAYRARCPDASVLLATGSHAAAMFEFPDGIDFVKLPSIVMVDRYRTWRSRDLPLPLNDVVQLRSDLLEHIVDGFAPDLLVADFMPAGPYGELLPALDRLERRGGAAIAGFRDVIDEPEFVRELWEETGVYDVLRNRYSAVCVYGDRAMTDFERDYGLDELADRLHYCGYLGRSPRQASDLPLYHRPFVVASCGGGVDGAQVIETFLHAAGPLARERDGTFLAVTGPLMPYEEHQRLSRLAEAQGVGVRRVVPELRAHLAMADCVVSMPGYNTVCDVISFQRPAVLVPRLGPSHEQLLRGERLEEWGAARILIDPGSETMRDAIVRALEGLPPAAAPVPLDGAERACDVFDSVLLHAPLPT